jgi:hypothetical protein
VGSNPTLSAKSHISKNQDWERAVTQNMKNLKFTSFAVFIVFFGIALIEAFQKNNWLEAALFLALGILSLWADMRKS